MARNKENNQRWHKEYYKTNKEEIKRKRKQRYKTSDYDTNYRLDEKDHCQDYRNSHKQESKQWKDNNKEHIKKYNKKYFKSRRASDLNFRILTNLRSRISKALQLNLDIRNNKTKELIGCSVQKLKQHLESQFKEGMFWDNYGFRGWQIDHIIPCDKFDLTDSEQQKECFHYTNLQPLWWLENIIKGSK